MNDDKVKEVLSNLLEKLSERFASFDLRRDADAGWRSRTADGSDGFVKYDTIAERDGLFKDRMRAEFDELSPDERIVLFKWILSDAEDEFLSASVERKPDRALLALLLIQLVSQVVPKW